MHFKAADDDDDDDDDGLIALKGQYLGNFPSLTAVLTKISKIYVFAQE